MSCRLANKSVTSHKENIMTTASRQEASVTKVKLALPASTGQRKLSSGRDAHLHRRTGVLCLKFSGAMPHLLSRASGRVVIWQHIGCLQKKIQVLQIPHTQRSWPNFCSVTIPAATMLFSIALLTPRSTKAVHNFAWLGFPSHGPQHFKSYLVCH